MAKILAKIVKSEAFVFDVYGYKNALVAGEFRIPAY